MTGIAIDTSIRSSHLHTQLSLSVLKDYELGLKQGCDSISLRKQI